MPSYNEIENENNPLSTVKKYLQKHNQKTGRNVIVYYSGWLNVDDEKVFIKLNDKQGFMNAIKDLDKSKGLDLIIQTPGGSVDATESIIDYLHSIFDDNIRVIVPLIAMSGGTMIACSA